MNLLFEDFDLASALKNAKLNIRQIFERGTLATPNDSAIPQNTQVLKTWIVEKIFHEEFGEKIGSYNLLRHNINVPCFRIIITNGISPRGRSK